MSYPIATDVIRRTQNKDGKCLDVRPWPEAPEAVALMNSDKASEEYFGRIELAMSTESARQLGRALIACAEEIERAQNDSREG